MKLVSYQKYNPVLASPEQCPDSSIEGSLTPDNRKALKVAKKRLRKRSDSDLKAAQVSSSFDTQDRDGNLRASLSTPNSSAQPAPSLPTKIDDFSKQALLPNEDLSTAAKDYRDNS